LAYNEALSEVFFSNDNGEIAFMASFPRLEVLRAVVDSGLIPVFHHPDAEVAFEVVRACARGGARVVEFTHRADFAQDVFAQVAQRCRRELPDVVFGVGSIRDPHIAALYLTTGANYVVSPTLQPELAKLLNGRKVAYFPGCATATEIQSAEELGCEIVKVFPGDCIGGPSFIKSVRGPSPWSSLMPTGGVELSEESIRAWIGAGAVAVGMGSKLVTKDVLASGNYDQLAENTAKALGWIRDARA